MKPYCFDCHSLVENCKCEHAMNDHKLSDAKFRKESEDPAMLSRLHDLKTEVRANQAQNLGNIPMPSMYRIYGDDAEFLFNKLDQLQAELAEAKAEIERFKNGVNNFRCPICNAVAGPLIPVSLLYEMAEIEKERDQLSAQLKACEAERDDFARMVDRYTLGEVNKLEKALRPFANIKADDGDDFSKFPDETIIRCEITAKDLRLARQALTDTKEADGE